MGTPRVDVQSAQPGSYRLYVNTHAQYSFGTPRRRGSPGAALCVSVQTWRRPTGTLAICAAGTPPVGPAYVERAAFQTIESQNTMLCTTKDLQYLAIEAQNGATDSAIGDVKDLYVDDEAWAIRYLVGEESGGQRAVAVESSHVD